MSSMTFESAHPTMLLDSNAGNSTMITCASASNNPMNQPPSMMMRQHHYSGFANQPVQHNISPLVYNNVGSTSAASSTTSSLSSSRTRLHFDGNDSGHSTATDSSQMLHNSLMYNNGMTEVDDLEPISRDRSNTWPRVRPALETQTSPLIHEQIPEEDSLYGSDEQLGDQQQTPQQPCNSGFTNTNEDSLTEMDEPDQFCENEMSSPLDESQLDLNELGEGTSSGTKKSVTRRNAWGNLSYADLITQAILSSPDKRLTLSQVYEWMVANVRYRLNLMELA
jgi:hypothetical protein